MKGILILRMLQTVDKVPSNRSGFSTFITAWIPVIGLLIAWALGVIGSLIGLYVLAGIIIQILVFAKIIKD